MTMWDCREESCQDKKGTYNIGNRIDPETGLDEHYCKECNVPLVRFMQDPDNPKSEWTWRRVGWRDIIHIEEYEEVVVKTRMVVERERI